VPDTNHPESRGQTDVWGYLRDLFCRPRMFGVQKPREFFVMLQAIDVFLDRPPDSSFSRIWSERLEFDIPGASIESCIEEIQDDWFRSMGLSADDTKLVQAVLEHRARWSGQKPDESLSLSKLPVEIRIDVQYVPVATCTECSTLMGSRSDGALIWFRCPMCDEGVVCPEQNIRRDVGRALADPSYRVRTWKTKWNKLPPEPPNS